MKKVTTKERYAPDGSLIERTVTVEETHESQPPVFSATPWWLVPYQYPAYLPAQPPTFTATCTGGGMIGAASSAITH